MPHTPGFISSGEKLEDGKAAALAAFRVVQGAGGERKKLIGKAGDCFLEYLWKFRAGEN
jgi:hypothetical protein